MGRTFQALEFKVTLLWIPARRRYVVIPIRPNWTERAYLGVTKNNWPVLNNHQVFDFIDTRRKFVGSKVQGLVLLVRKPCNFET